MYFQFLFIKTCKYAINVIKYNIISVIYKPQFINIKVFF